MPNVIARIFSGETTAAIRATVTKLEERQAAVHKRREENTSRRGALAYAAGSGNEDVQSELDRASVNAYDLARDLEEISLALEVARQRLADAEAAENLKHRDARLAAAEKALKQREKLASEAQRLLRELATVCDEMSQCGDLALTVSREVAAGQSRYAVDQDLGPQNFAGRLLDVAAHSGLQQHLQIEMHWSGSVRDNLQTCERAVHDRLRSMWAEIVQPLQGAA